MQTLYIDKHVIIVISSTASGEGNQSSSDSISPQKQAQQGTSREGMQITPTQGKLVLCCLFVHIVPIIIEAKLLYYEYHSKLYPTLRMDVTS